LIAIVTRNNDNVIFTYDAINEQNIIDFFAKVNLHIQEKKDKISIDENLLTVRTFEERLMGKIEFTVFWLIVFLIALIVSVIPLFNNNQLLLISVGLTALIVNGFIGIFRLRDLGKSPFNVILYLLIPVVNLYFLFLFLTKKGILSEKLEKEILI
jgi:hypothetical protein